MYLARGEGIRVLVLGGEAVLLEEAPRGGGVAAVAARTAGEATARQHVLGRQLDLRCSVGGDAHAIAHGLHATECPAASAGRLVPDVADHLALGPRRARVKGDRHLDVVVLLSRTEVGLRLLGFGQGAHERLDLESGGVECITLPSSPSTNPHAALHQLSPRHSSRTSPSVKPLNLAFSPAVQVQATSLTSWTVCWCAGFSPARHHDSAPTRRLKRTAMQGAREGNCRRGAGGRCERQSAQGVRRCGGRAGAPCAARGGQRAPLRETLAQTAA